MKKLFAVLACGLLCAFLVAAQAAQEKPQPQQQEKQTQASASASTKTSASAQAGGSSASLESGTTFEAELSKSVDAKKNKPGDRVEAKATKDVKSNGQVVVPKNSKLIGRVTEAKARGEGQSESSLGILFEKAVTKDGREIPLNNVAIQAVALSRSEFAAQTQRADMMGSTSTAGSASGAARGGAAPSGGVVGGATGAVGSTVGATTGAVGGVGQTVGGAVGATTQTATSVAGAIGPAGLDATGNLTSNSSGVLGLQGMALQSQSAGSAQGSVITSTSRNVHLNSGTRFLLRAAGQASAASQPQ